MTFEVLGHLILRPGPRGARRPRRRRPARRRRRPARRALRAAARRRLHRLVRRAPARGRRPDGARRRPPTGPPPRGSPAPGCPASSDGILPLALLSLGAPDGAACRRRLRPVRAVGAPAHRSSRGHADPRLPARPAVRGPHLPARHDGRSRPATGRRWSGSTPSCCRPPDELAGAGSGLLTLGPVALHLGHLAAALGRHDEAAEHRARAEAVGARVPVVPEGRGGQAPRGIGGRSREG